MNGNLQCSPLNILQAANLYVFGVNNPVRYVDPSGLIIELPQAPKRYDFGGGRRNQIKYEEAKSAYEIALAGYNRAISYLIKGF